MNPNDEHLKFDERYGIAESLRQLELDYICILINIDVRVRLRVPRLIIWILKLMTK